MLSNLPQKVYIREVGPRDGLQIEPAYVPTPVKAEFIRRLVATGLPHIEITSFVHPRWIPALADCEDIGREFARCNGTHTSALVPNQRGLDNAVHTGMREVTVFLSASESHNKANINRSVDETLEQYDALIPAAKAQGLEVVGTISVVCGCPYEGEVKPERVAEIARRLVDAGADYLMLGDTIGVGTPVQVQRLLEQVMPLLPAKRIGLHLHDTQGTALANALAGLEMGITCFDGAVGGLGGCPYAPGASGNVPTENLVYMFEQMGIRTGVNLDGLLETAAWIQEVLDHPLPSTGLKAYLGRRTRAAEQARQAASAAS